MTALDIVGLSVSVLKLSGDGATLAALDAPCAAPAWPGGGAVSRAHRRGARAAAGDGRGLAVRREAAAGGAARRRGERPRGGGAQGGGEQPPRPEAQLTAWDEVCGDGDCGSTSPPAPTPS